jgi:malate dehydrogenase
MKLSRLRMVLVPPLFPWLLQDKTGAESVKNAVGNDVEYFSVPVELGPNGVEKILPLGEINAYEKKLFDAATAELKGNIAKGSSFITENPKL